MPKSFSRLYFHFVWHTRNNEPYLSDEIEHFVYPCIAQKCKQEGYRLLEINGMPNHIHLLVSLRPTVLLSEFAHIIKGSSSYDTNRQFNGGGKLYWQSGYGITSVSPKDVPMIRDYIRRQKEHHKLKRVKEELESTEETDL